MKRFEQLCVTKFWRSLKTGHGSKIGLAGAMLALAVAGPSLASSLVDLHAHLFMPEASGLPGVGSFDEPLRARDWTDRLKTRVNADALEKSKAKIVVVSFYSHPLFLRAPWKSQRVIIQRQIEATKRFVESHPDWAIAKSPPEARKALADGKRVLILSIEGASGVIENEEDVQEFVDRLGVRIVTPIHFTDDRIGGAAFMPGIEILVNPVAALHSWFSPHEDANGVRINPQGLTSQGRALVASLIRHGAWIDLSHSSDASVHDMEPLLKIAGQPWLFTHTMLRNGFHAERGINEWEMREVAETQGIVGLLPSDDMMRGTKVDPRFCPVSCSGRCEGGIAAFDTQFSELSKIISPDHIVYGTDVDAPLTFLQPGCEKAEFENPRGYWSYAQLPDLQQSLEKNGLVSPSIDEVEVFLRTWALAVAKRLEHNEEIH